MNASYRIFTIESGTVTDGAAVENLPLKGAGISIPAVIVGEEGRGRARGVLPVGNYAHPPCPERGKAGISTFPCSRCGEIPLRTGEDQIHTIHPDSGVIEGRLRFAEIGTTQAGKPKLLAHDKMTVASQAIVIFQTKIGFRGGNSHFGDRLGWRCTKCTAEGKGDPPDTCPECKAEAGSWSAGPRYLYAKFPGEILVEGTIAQGAAGNAGSGSQMVALVPTGVVFRTGYSGRLYGAPNAHYYLLTEDKLLGGLTDEERGVSDAF